MADIIDFRRKKAQQNVERLFEKARELTAAAKLLNPSNVKDISDLLTIRKLEQLPPEILSPLVSAYKEGESAFENKDYEKAIVVFGELVQSEYLEPDINISFRLAYSLFKCKRLDEAINVCQDAILNVPQKLPFYTLLGDCYARQGTLETIDNALYCVDKATTMAQAEQDYVTAIKLLYELWPAIRKSSYCVVVMDHNFDVADGKAFSYQFMLKNDVSGYTASGEIPTTVFNGKEINIKLLPKKEIFPALLKNLRYHITEKIGKPIYFSSQVLDKESVTEEDVSYRTFEKE